MRRNTLTLEQKIWLMISLSVILTVSFSSFLLDYFYQKLYVDKVEQTLLQEGKSLASDYHGGEVSETFRKQIEWYDEKSTAEVILVNNPRELSACLPFDIDYQSLISGKDRAKLLRGETVTKIGYEKRFHRKIMGVIIPLLDDHRLQGAIYLYIPLASIQELTKEVAMIWLPLAALFVFVLLIAGKRLVRHITGPLKEMEEVAYHMSQGNYEAQIPVRTNDEIGKLAKAFNIMAKAVAEEDMRKREFLANVSHELRTPISYVKGYSEAILQGLVKTKEEQRKHVQLIYREAGRMERLVRDLLDLAQLEGNSVPLQKVPLVFAQVIEDTVAKYEPFLQKKQITLAVELDHDIILEGDADRLEQVVQNLLDNAVRYTPDAGKIDIQLRKVSAKSCQLIIRDSGKGVPKEKLAFLGQRFFRVDQARSRKEGGTGLGLAIVKQIISLHDGTISFFSEEGKGMEVVIELPIYPE
ncbi:sensor histidine kinase [Parageobacillus thermoglucosidasius]|uniref:sensor histidine kinase n=1 Tax=Parageobacillus thermoglucosidasius TaxID=1426 RepID=UPI0001D1845D|nr:ATP-binding protein [Parageobacillus thermoglucosidasius]AEH47673.1 integral membrane sensor signal transduction histidine kinase [Parageobacillus thermoglucosidasius C56-YS93]MED4903374.1 ATP-binding protein [Parageobacillus thermoglucosidasius]MED4912917.1 ATP-binding protein [Parageobacillus thermoglucosidasius]MED4945307.1 ATP-binding protein [Parageobacillus thermoglucosidasius]MED4984489.1 ATP-binding protein [Parageobacillus thermoglucosidasius]